MVTVNPFRGLRFDPDVIGDPGRVLVPPYDSISPRARDDFEACSAYNMVRLIFDPAGRYDHAAKLLQSWIDEGALRPERDPSLYMYEQSTVPGPRGGCTGTEAERALENAGGDGGAGQARRLQRGLLASVPLDAGRTWVLPHERTMPAVVADRLRLLGATRTDLSPIFGLYAASGRSVPLLDASTTGEPVIDCVDGAGIRHRLWPVADPSLIDRWRGLLTDRQVLIADGHHRYRTALEHQAAWRAKHPGVAAGPVDEVLMFLADAEAEGPSILPMHRLLETVGPTEVVRATAGLFEARPVPGGPGDAEAALRRLPADVPAFGLHGPDGTWVLTATDPGALAGLLGAAGGEARPLDVDVLHELVLGRCLGMAEEGGSVAYEVDRDLAARQVAEGRYRSLVLLRPVPFPVVLRIAREGGTLPPKTTWFSPKPRDGLVLRQMDGLDQ